MKKSNLGIGLLGGFLALFVLGKSYDRREKIDFGSGPLALSAADPRPVSTPPPVPPSRVSIQRVGSLTHSEEGVAEKLGPYLKAEFLKSGQLISVRGEFGKGTFGDADFRADDAKRVIARATEIISKASPLLGVADDWPLGNAVAKLGPRSAQVYLKQTYQGIPLAPVGSVKVDLGPQGELVGLYSDYVSGVALKNELRLNPIEAKDRALAAATSSSIPNLAFRMDGGSRVIWVQGKQGYYAYLFNGGGHEWVIDAKTGHVLFIKDRRHF